MLFFHINSFCRVFFRSTGGTSRRLSVTLANGSYNLRRHTPVYNIPFRDYRTCVKHLIRGNCGITVYRRIRSPTATGKLIGHSVVHAMAPNAILRSDLLSRNEGGCLTTVTLDSGRVNIYFASTSANRYRTAFLPRSSFRAHLISRVSHFSPGRVLVDDSFGTGTPRIFGCFSACFRNDLARHRVADFGLRGARSLVLGRFGIVDIRGVNLAGNDTRTSTFNTVLRCLCRANIGKRVSIGGIQICANGRFVGLSVATIHGLRLYRAVQLGTGGNSLL